MKGHIKVCKLLIENREDKCPEDDIGSTPLHSAAFYGQNAICKLIMLRVEEKNPKDYLGRTPFHIAGSNGLYKTCEIIIEHLEYKNDIICQICKDHPQEYVCHITRKRLQSGSRC